MKKYYASLICFFCVIGSFAQFNDTVDYYLGYAGTGIINKTEASNSYVFNNVVKANIGKKALSLNSTHTWIYGEQDKQLSNNDFTSTLDLNYQKPGSRLAYWALGNFDKSYSLNIVHRIQYGGGASYDLVNRKNLRINLSNGLLYESSNLQLNDSTRDRYETWRNSFRLKYRLSVKELVVLESVHFLQNSLSSKSDYLIKSNTTLAFKIYRFIHFTTALTYNKLNRLRRQNMLITFGISLEKYF